MKSLGRAMRILKDATSVAPTVGAARTLSAVAAEFDSLFPQGSGGPATRAKPVIWTDMADFKGKIGGFRQAVATLLKLGMLPDGDFVGGAMAEVVAGGTSKLNAADLAALAHYLENLPAKANNPFGKR